MSVGALEAVGALTVREHDRNLWSDFLISVVLSLLVDLCLPVR